MKRFICILLCIIMVMGFVACDNSPEAPKSSGSTSTGEDDDITPSEEPEKPFLGQTVRITSWGGSYESTLRDLVKPRFEEETGATMEIILGSAPLAQLKVEGDDPSVDVLHTNYYEMMNAKLLDVSGELNYSAMPNAADLYPEAKEEAYGVVTNWGTRGIAYRNDLIDAPTSWADLWNPEYKGKVVISDVTFGGGYELAEMTCRTFFNGASMVDKENWDKTFEKLAELAPSVYYISTQHSDTDTALINGDAVIAVHTNGRTAMLSNDGYENISYADLKEGLPGMATYVAVSKNTKVPGLATALVDALIGPDAQYEYATNNYYAPSNSKCEIPDDLIPFMPYGQEAVSKLIYFDQDMLSEADRAEFVELWNKVFKN